jgi:hypothetical protein
MRIVIPPGQNISKVEASVAVSRTEATELRDALDAVLTLGVSRWHVDASWGENRTDVDVSLTLMTPGERPTHM